MAALIDDILDFARGRLGGGFMLERNPNAPLSDHLEQVIGELRGLSENPIEAQINLTRPVELRSETRRSNRFKPCRQRDEARRSRSAYPDLGVD